MQKTMQHCKACEKEVERTINIPCTKLTQLCQDCFDHKITSPEEYKAYVAAHSASLRVSEPQQELVTIVDPIGGELRRSPQTQELTPLLSVPMPRR